MGRTGQFSEFEKVFRSALSTNRDGASDVPGEELDALLRVATDLGVGYEIIRWMSSRRLKPPTKDKPK